MNESSACLFGKRENNEKRVFFEITNTCNMRCKHCMNNSSNGVSTDLEKEQIFDLFTELHEHRVDHLYISGGEPLLYDGIDEVFQHAFDLGMKITLATNGLEIENHLFAIKKYVEVVSLSLDGIGETHDLFRGVSGAFAHAVKMLALLKTENVKTKISTIIWKQNVRELDSIVNLAKSMEAMKINLNILVPLGRAKRNIDIHIPTTEYHDVYEKVNILINKYRNDSFNIEIKRRHELKNDSLTCPGGKFMFHINSQGKVSPCSWLSKIDDKNDFSYYWEKSNLDVCFNACRKIESILDARERIFGFSGCPALSKIHNGDFLSQDPLNGMI